jgi:hypothetical protein
MFISKSVYNRLYEEKVTAQADSRALVVQVAQLQSHVEWMQVRMTQIEFERAGLIKRYMGIDVPVATFEAPPDHPDPNETPDFNDVGDAEAARLGLEWGLDGTVQRSKK